MSDSNSKSSAGWGTINGWWYASAALIGLVLLGLLIVLLFPNDEDGAGGATSSSSAGTGEEATEGWEDTGCNGTEGSSEIPTSPPSDVEWVPLGAMSVPQSGEYGPLQVDDPPLRQCYQHSPTGALFAAINIPAAGSSTGSGADLEAVARQQMTPGPTQEQFLAAAASGDAETSADTVAAFQISACTPDRCNVSVVANSGGQLVQGTYSLVWVDGDWKLDGTQQIAASALDAVPAGFVQWAPEV